MMITMKSLMCLRAGLMTLTLISSVGLLPAQADGSFSSLANLSRITSGESRSVSSENFTGEKGQAGMATNGTGEHAASELGQGWKESPSVVIRAGTTFTLADIKGPGDIQQIWMTPAGNWHQAILRFYWDDETNAAVESPVGDFFAWGLGQYAQINSLPVCVNPGSAFNCYWQMPFQKRARITMENRDTGDMVLYYQINYVREKISKKAGYFHAQYRQEYPLKTKGLYTILDGVKGEGQYVGTYLTIKTHEGGWWGEGEIKFYLDGDRDFPTICGTGTEDYFCGSYNFESPTTHKYQTFSTPYSGLVQVLPPDKTYEPEQSFGLYRWHIADPIRFKKDLKVTIQALGWKDHGLYLQMNSEMSSVAYWYQK